VATYREKKGRLAGERKTGVEKQNVLDEITTKIKGGTGGDGSKRASFSCGLSKAATLKIWSPRKLDSCYYYRAGEY